jgi:hypothetical protein
MESALRWPARPERALMIAVAGFSLLRTSLAADPGTWALHKLDLAAYPAAQCLDGTPGALYVSLSPTGSKTWVFHLQGGEFRGARDGLSSQTRAAARSPSPRAARVGARRARESASLAWERAARVGARR